MPNRGICKLCLQEADLLKSHYIPRALYPTKKQKSATSARDAILVGPTPHLRDYLLCRACETRFEQNGESEVLKWLAPKVKRYPLNERFKLALPRERYADASRFAAYDVGLDAEKFAYFASSVVWRGSVHEWLLSNGCRSTLLTMGTHQETVRRFLIGDVGFPHDVMSVIVIVCSDPEARSLWNIPAQDEENGCLQYRFVARGVFFTVILGSNIPPLLRDACCVGPRQCIVYGDAAHRMKESFSKLLHAPVR